MSKKLILVFVAVFFLIGLRSALAGEVVINEFLSDPDSGSEWIELFNDSSSSVDLSNWAWTEIVGPGGDTEHESSLKSLSGIIFPGEFYVFEMNNALNNAGDSIGLYRDQILKDRVTFGKVNSYSKNLDAPIKGKSGAYINDDWLTDQNPTKGTVNPDSASSGDDSGENTNTNSSSDNGMAETETKTATNQKIKLQITGKSLVCVGIPFALEGKVFGTNGEQLFSGKYYWNFGDGDFRETRVINVDKFEHTYFYPGEYTILLEHYPNLFADVPDAVEKLTVKVVAPEISISAVGGGTDFFVELANNTNYNIDLSHWFLLSGQKSFLIPRETNLAAKSKIIFSSKITHFSVEDKNNLKLMNPQGQLVFDYSLSAPPKRQTLKTATQNTGFQSESMKTVDSSFLGASVIESDILEEKNPASLPIISIFTFLFIVISAGLVYFIRQKNVTSEAGDDFEVLDE